MSNGFTCRNPLLPPRRAKTTSRKRSRSRERERSRSRERSPVCAPPTSLGATLVVYVDGSCFGNGGPHATAGWGVYYGPDDARNAHGPVEGEATNNRGELTAILHVLRATADEARRVVVRSDSTYARDCLRWSRTWRRNNWCKPDGTPAKNRDLVQPMVEMLEARRGLTVVEYVKAHAGIAGNEAADALAKRGAALYGRKSADRPTGPE